jgi:hypothetical protein
VGFLFWLGRMTLWFLFLPLGIWRSLVHHRKKAQRRAVAQMRDQQRP